MTDLSPPTTRILPTIHDRRVDISLFEAQFDPESGKRIPIPQKIVDSVVAALLRFQIICKDLGVPDSQFRVIATEATREAINADDFLKAIKKATGLSVHLLPKEDEGRIGALGVASGYSDIQGLVMDLGGGSTQLTWMVSQAGNIRISPKGAISFPYGAAAITRKLADLREDKTRGEAEHEVAHFRQEMSANFVEAHSKLQIPDELVDKAKKQGGYDLYLSGGGFRGWGYLILYLNQVQGHNYPISLINGFTASRSQFEDTRVLENVAHAANKIFKVSDRRRSQVPAVAFLVDALSRAIPHGIKRVHFCQGGVREGILFSELSPTIRKMDPMETATMRVAPRSAEGLYSLLLSAIPSPSESGTKAFPQSISHNVIRAFINLLYVQSVMTKETASTAALHCTSTGLLASVNGISHTDRARLALMLEERYHGELPPREVDFKKALQSLLSSEEIWWTRYIGKIGLLIASLYPAGEIDDFKPRVAMSANWSHHLGKRMDKKGIELTVSVQKVKRDPMKLKEAIEDHKNVIEKIGKRKNWVGGKDGWGMVVKTKVVEEDLN